MPLLTSLLVLIVVARLLGQLFARFKQPPIVGEMIAGVLLGPAVLGFVHATPALRGISELAVFLVVLSAGLEMNLSDVVRAMSGKGLVIALLGFFLPLAAGIGVGVAFQLDLMRTVFLGLCISITALPVAVRILESFKMLNSEIARYSIATAILNDIAALLILGVILNLPQTGSISTIALMVAVTIGKLFLFAGMVWGIHRLLTWMENVGIAVNLIPERIVKLFGPEALFGMVAVFVLVFASVSEVLGFHFVIGAFFGGLLIKKQHFLAARYADIERTLGSVTGGFLAPLFFAYLGLEFDAREMRSVSFVATVLLVSIASKVIAGWLGGRLIGLSQRDAMGIGVMLNGRGVMELVIAGIAFEHNFIGRGTFSTLVLMGVVTTILTPILFRRVLRKTSGKEPAQHGS